MHRPASQIAAELVACIRCNECLDVCPALATSLPVAAVNRQTLDGPVSPEVARFAQGCILCGACVPVCPVGLHRDAMMLWLKLRLLRGDVPVAASLPEYGDTDNSLAAVPGLVAAPATYRPPSRGAGRSPAGDAVPRGQSAPRQNVGRGPRPLTVGKSGGEDW